MENCKLSSYNLIFAILKSIIIFFTSAFLSVIKNFLDFENDNSIAVIIFSTHIAQWHEYLFFIHMSLKLVQ